MYNPFSIQRHLNPRASGLITYGGGGGDAPAAPAVPVAPVAPAAPVEPTTPAPVFTSTFEELAGITWATDAERITAEGVVTEERAATAAAATAKATQEAAEAQRVEMSNTASDMQLKSLQDPASLATTAAVSNIDTDAAGTNIAEGTGAITGGAPQVPLPGLTPAATTAPVTATADVTAANANMTATEGAVSADSLVEDVQGDPSEMSALELEAAQIAAAKTVAVVPPIAVQPEEMISGSAVDMAAVTEATDVQAATADPSVQATVKGQMAELMTEFDGGDPPPWAAGALRNATAAMAARGLGASSMAGQALIQAAMESALPIAMQDAKTYASFEGQNLSNRQQATMFGAEQRAQFLGMKFTQEFQAKVANASRIAEVANMNFTAEQQVALENARMAQTVDITNLNALNAKMMADAAAMSQMDLQNLNNRQQAAVTNANAFLAMDMKNIDMLQQTEMFKAQSIIQSIFSDQAATNASNQFNASSENQTNQFFANMAAQVDQFNAGMDLQYDQFNAKNALVVAQANAQWRQNATTIDTAEQNQANRDSALAANGFTTSMIDTVWQRERDIMDYAFRMSQGDNDRALSVFLADKQAAAQASSEQGRIDLAKWESGRAESAADKQGKGYIFTRLLFG